MAVYQINPREWMQSESASAMDFLNGVAERFPNAISLAAGRPPDALRSASRVPHYLETGIAKEATRNAATVNDIWRRFGQYSDTNGVIDPVLSRLLHVTENVDTDGLVFQVTNGIQEALLIECLHASAEGGAAIAFDPTYVGMAGAAALAGLPLYVTPRNDDPVAALEETAAHARGEITGPLLCYVVADHDNPSSLSMSLTQRRQLIELAIKYDLLILEDTAYRMFNYATERTTSLFALDWHGCVVHLVSFSKTFLPGLRIGFTARRASSPSGDDAIARLTAIKSFSSVLTSPLIQATISGFLDGIGFDLDAENRERRERCRENRDVLLSVLSDRLGGIESITWTNPLGGFFVAVQVPFTVNANEARRIAEDHHVLVVPLSLFSPSGTIDQQVRLSFSFGSTHQIAEGAERFSAYALSRLPHRG